MFVPSLRSGVFRVSHMTSVELELLRGNFLAALREDIGSGDITSRSTISPGERGYARIAAKQHLTAAGLAVAAEIMRLVDRDIEFCAQAVDAACVNTGVIL